MCSYPIKPLEASAKKQILMVMWLGWCFHPSSYRKLSLLPFYLRLMDISPTTMQSNSEGALRGMPRPGPQRGSLHLTLDSLRTRMLTGTPGTKGRVVTYRCLLQLTQRHAPCTRAVRAQTPTPVAPGNQHENL